MRLSGGGGGGGSEGQLVLPHSPFTYTCMFLSSLETIVQFTNYRYSHAMYTNRTIIYIMLPSHSLYIGWR